MTGIYATIGVFGIFVSVIAWKLTAIRNRNKRRAQLMSQSIPNVWQSMIEKNVPLYKRVEDAVTWTGEQSKNEFKTLNNDRFRN